MTGENDWTSHIPDPPQALDALHRLIADIHWHQRWEVFKGDFTPGDNDVLVFLVSW